MKLLATEEMHDLFVKTKASDNCRNIAIKFSTKIAMKFAIMSLKYDTRAWNLAKILYQELRTGSWTYTFDTREFTRIEPVK